MIALIENLTGITRLEHALREPGGFFADSTLDFIVSLDPVVRNRAHELGWPVFPVLYEDHRSTLRRKDAIKRLTLLKQRVLGSSRFTKIGRRYFIVLHVIYRFVQSQLMGNATTELNRYEAAIRGCLRGAKPDVAVAAHGPLGLLAIAALDLEVERIHLL